MIIEGFDNAWHVLRHWAENNYQYFLLEHAGRVPTPRPLHLTEIAESAIANLDYFPIPTLAADAIGDNPDPSRTLTAAEILLAAAIAEGWEPEIE